MDVSQDPSQAVSESNIQAVSGSKNNLLASTSPQAALPRTSNFSQQVTTALQALSTAIHQGSMKQVLAGCKTNSTTKCHGSFDLIQKIELVSSRDSSLKIPATIFSIAKDGEQHFVILVDGTEELSQEELVHLRFQDLELCLADRDVASKVLGEAVALASDAGVGFRSLNQDCHIEDMSETQGRDVFEKKSIQYDLKSSRIRKEVLDAGLGEGVAQLISSMVGGSVKTAVKSKREPNLLYIKPEQETQRISYAAKIASTLGAGKSSSLALTFKSQ